MLGAEKGLDKVEVTMEDSNEAGQIRVDRTEAEHTQNGMLRTQQSAIRPVYANKVTSLDFGVSVPGKTGSSPNTGLSISHFDGLVQSPHATSPYPPLFAPKSTQLPDEDISTLKHGENAGNFSSKYHSYDTPGHFFFVPLSSFIDTTDYREGDWYTNDTYYRDATDLGVFTIAGKYPEPEVVPEGNDNNTKGIKIPESDKRMVIKVLIQSQMSMVTIHLKKVLG